MVGLLLLVVGAVIVAFHVLAATGVLYVTTASVVLVFGSLLLAIGAACVGTGLWLLLRRLDGLLIAHEHAEDDSGT